MFINCSAIVENYNTFYICESKSDPSVNSPRYTTTLFTLVVLCGLLLIVQIVTQYNPLVSNIRTFAYIVTKAIRRISISFGYRPPFVYFSRRYEYEEVPLQHFPSSGPSPGLRDEEAGVRR